MVIFEWICCPAKQGKKRKREVSAKDYSEIVTVYNDNIDLYIHDFFEKRVYPEKLTEDYIIKASQSVWNACLMYLRKNVTNTINLKEDNIYQIESPNINSSKVLNTNFNSYNYDLLLYIVDIYIYYCMVYDKEVSIIGFSLLTGIDNTTIDKWKNNNNGNSVNPVSFLIYQKLCQYREESLSNKLATGNKNPVGILAILNRFYNWNSNTIQVVQSGSADPQTIAEKYRTAALPEKPEI